MIETKDLEELAEEFGHIGVEDAARLFVHAWQTLHGEPLPSDTDEVARGFHGFCEVHRVVPSDRFMLWVEVACALELNLKVETE
jgi:hypothetical protein